MNELTQLTEPLPLTKDEIFKIPEQAGVLVLYKTGIVPILVDAEEGSLRKRLLRCKEQYPDAASFSVGGLGFTKHSEREDLAETVCKELGLGKQARGVIGFARPA